MEEEDEVYGGEIPEDVEAEGEAEGEGAPKDDGEGKGDDAELEVMKARLKEMEEEAAKLRAMQAKVEKEMGTPAAASSDNPAAKEEVDARSIYVGNVDYSTTPEELQMHFQSCGTVNRVTILTDKFGAPKGYAYIEFLEAEAVNNAILLNESEVHGRQIKVTAKRTNVPGMKQRRFRPPPYGSPYGYRPRRPRHSPLCQG
eukprot:jgi/Mesvir1/17645/Mv08863-RA.1